MLSCTANFLLSAARASARSGVFGLMENEHVV
jgi:hypothetical protein